MIVALSGPSGAGKTLATDLAVQRLGCARVVPRTTRPARAHERTGVDYEFVTIEEFQAGIRAGRFVDWDYLLGHYYGYERELAEGEADQSRVVVPVVARMALRLRQHLSGVVLVFLDGPDHVLDTRIQGRVATGAELAMRHAHRQEERRHASLFDLRVPDAATMDERELVALIARAVDGV